MDLENLIDQLKEGIVDEVVGQLTKNLKPLLINQGNKDEEILTIGELSKHLKVTVNWIYKKVSSKEIPYHKPGGSLRFRKKEIDEWFNGSYTPYVNISKIDKKGLGT
ncbi:MAG: helix-turn-helix domain-containing protein [Candidatus Scalindua sp.]